MTIRDQDKYQCGDDCNGECSGEIDGIPHCIHSHQRNIKPGKSDIYTRSDCRDAKIIRGVVTNPGLGKRRWESPEPCCQHENFPWVEFPRGSGNRDPLYCSVACASRLCPEGYVQ